MMSLPPWIADQLAEIREALGQGRLGHAVLLHGPSGWGELRLADAVARLLLGVERTVDAATLAHPDLRWLAGSGAGAQIKIDDVRAVAEFAVQTPQIAQRKVVVVAGAERMNAHAANALLKTLEEPPGACYLVLTTTALAELLPTIRSRCQLRPIRVPGAAVAQRWLDELGLDADPDTLVALAFEYGHAPIDVVEAVARDEQPLREDLSGVGAGTVDALAVAERWARLDVDNVLARWMRYVRRQLGDPADGSAAPAWVGPEPCRWRRYFERLVVARAAVRSTTNPNARLLLEGLLLEWRRMFATRA